MDQRAQISAEFILFVAIVLAVVLVFAVVVSDQSEMNSIATAAREGAANATAQISILNASMTPVRVTNISMTNMTGGYNVTIVINLSNPGLSAAQKDIILGGAMQSINSTGYQSITNTVTTSKHNYTISVA